ncbi:Cyclin-dependent kinase inhibitor 7 [Morus notabilis]|uniref:Cyclin-dependent kinase inhibitor 7 n=1 Tax=Morus notabilis TaxID=981085 RepID=W9SMM4_9ROSA|nr:Cyclin-dependent kinase inhibitor 7 [Morus notabilis]
MGDCKRNAGISAMGAASSADNTSKRRKIEEFSTVDIDDDGDDELGIGRLGVNSPVKYWDDGDTCSASFCLDRSPASCCSSNESSDVVKDGLRLVDLELFMHFQSKQTVLDLLSDLSRYKLLLETTSPSSELSVDSEETAAADRRRRSPAAEKAPPEDEIEKFFAVAEKSEQKRFAEKYNYDIVNDMPLEGRYHWVCLKP